MQSTAYHTRYFSTSTSRAMISTHVQESKTTTTIQWLTHMHKNYTRRLQQHLPGVLNVLFDLDQESHSFPAVKKPVVVCERKVHHLY